MKQLFRATYLQERFFIILVILVLGFILAYIFPGLLDILKFLFYLFLVSIFIDLFLIFSRGKGVSGERIVPEKLSNGDDNPIKIRVINSYPFRISARIIDELPQQFQKRDFEIKTTLSPRENKFFNYDLRPTERGVYVFGNLIIFASSPLGLIAKKYTYNKTREVPVYPSFLQLRKYDLMAFTNRLFEYGLKKIRRIGHTMEFEQIKEYVQGDDIRNINWKATAKKSQLMVNQYQDEKSQPVYSVIDKGRVMKMPFEELSLLDYAINATLVISNIAIKKQDKAGMFAFSNGVENRVVAERRSSQMNLILETLYNLQTNFAESDF